MRPYLKFRQKQHSLSHAEEERKILEVAAM